MKAIKLTFIISSMANATKQILALFDLHEVSCNKHSLMFSGPANAWLHIMW